MKRSTKRFLKYSSIASFTFLLDLLLLYVLTDVFGIHYLISAALAFVMAVSINYAVSRQWVFKETTREAKRGYVYFILISLGSLLVITGAMYLFVDVFGVHYMVARVLIGALVGGMGYLVNLFFNFKVAERQL